MLPPKSVGSASNTFGGILDGFFDQVNQTIQKTVQEARDAGIEIEIEAGREISLAIENAKNVYKAELDYTIDKISTAAKNALDGLSSIVQKFQKTTGKELQELELQAQQLLNSLPFTSKEPQLTSVVPRYMVIDSTARDALITFKGNFPSSAKEGFEPSLNFGNINCKLADSTTQSLTFQVPESIFQNTPQNQYSYKTGNLQIPWDDGIIFSHKVESDYKVGLGAIPQLAGKGTVEFDAHDIQHNTKPATTQDYVINGNNWYPQEWHTVDTAIVPEPGWIIDMSKPPNLVWSHLHGKHEQEVLSVSPNEIVIRVRVYCKDGHDIGIMQFRVDYNVYQDVPVVRPRIQNFQLNWKDSILLVPQPKEVITKVTFNDYKGTHQEYGAPTLDGILQIEAEGNGSWKIWAEPPANLKLSSTDLSKELIEKIRLAHKYKHLLNLQNLKENPKATDKKESKIQITAPQEKRADPLVEEIKKN